MVSSLSSFGFICRCLDRNRLSAPALAGRVPGDLGPPLLPQLRRTSRAALLPERLRRWILAVADLSRLFDLARRDLRHHDGGAHHVARPLLASWSLGHTRS